MNKLLDEPWCYALLALVFVVMALIITELDKHSLAGFCCDHDAVIQYYEKRTIDERDDYRGVRVIEVVTCRVRLPSGQVLDENDLRKHGVFLN